MKVRHCDFVVTTDAPDTWRSLFRQRRLWWAGNFRHWSVNVDKNLVHRPVMTLYAFAGIWLSVYWKWWGMIDLRALPFTLFALWVFYVFWMFVANFQVRSRYMLLMPFYSLAQGLVMPALGALMYVRIARRRGSLGPLPLRLPQAPRRARRRCPSVGRPGRLRERAPAHRCPDRGREEGAERREDPGDLGALLLRRDVPGEVGEHLSQLVGVLCAVVGAAGPPRHRLQGRHIGAAAEAAAATAESAPPPPNPPAAEAASAEPVGVEGVGAELVARAGRTARGSPSRSRSCTREPAARPRTARRRAARARGCSRRRSGARRCRARSRWRRASPPAGGRPVSGASPTGATSGFTSAMASRPLSMAAPMAVPRPVVSDSIAATSAFRSVVGGTAQLREAREDDEGHANALRLVLDELAGSVLRDGQPVGLDVGRAHRPGDVDREDDRRPRVGNAALHVRATGGDRERDEAQRAAGRREGAAATASASAAASAAARRSSSERPACAGGAASTSTRRGARGRRSATAARAATRTTAQITRPNHTIERTEPSASRSPPAAANRAVTSRGLLDALELEVDRLVDPRERLGVARLVVRAVGDLGDLLQHVLVERRRDAEAVDLDDRAFLRADADRCGCGRRRSTRPRRA